MEQSQKLTVWDRLKMPTPRFFRRVRAIGAALGALGMVLTTTQVPLPAIIITIGSYLILAGSVAAAISSVAVEPEMGTPPPPATRSTAQQQLSGPAATE
ncbi:hypothetical protein J0X19_22620 [Hymenobacter sp. BT186]|uniref:Uncharacterized protein n=1 Tax=Hymenobacter telluris TaxID=2816474 RepID=A0A939F1T0_9BACT|nr:hypothetical protein [Hymenobacter telluris]MBO0360772.1 hypothetical protein [Hymenobacter telluris]MBW3376800.1 hypothetical protein [Hymenobacter norwichensis]